MVLSTCWYIWLLLFPLRSTLSYSCVSPRRRTLTSDPINLSSENVERSAAGNAMKVTPNGSCFTDKKPICL